MTVDKNCLFCRIVGREIPAEILLETNEVLAFKDIKPVAPVHLLVIPKEHVSGVDAVASASRPVMEAVTRAANELASRHGVARSGYRLVINSGDDAGQTVGHLHMHVLGGRPMAWPPG